jgi:predicted permease
MFDLREGRRAARGLWRSRAFAAGGLLTIAIAVGAGTAITRAAYDRLLAPLPFANERELVSIALSPNMPASKRTLEALRERTQAFGSITGWSPWGFLITGTGAAELVQGGRATADFFAVVGTRPQLGRLFIEEDGQPGRDRVAVLGHAFWQRRFGGAGDAIGSVLRVNGETVTIVGVLPSEFAFPPGSGDVWMPLAIDRADARDYTAGYLQLLGRVGPSVDIDAAARDLHAALARMRAEQPAVYSSQFGQNAQLRRLRAALVANHRTLLRLLLLAASLVVLVAAANLASLVLTRGVARQRELAIRSALGASRRSILLVVISELVLLGALGTVAGLACAYVSAPLLAPLLPASLRAGSGSFFGYLIAAALIAVVPMTFAVLSGLRIAAGAGRSALRTREQTVSRKASSALRLIVAGEVALGCAIAVVGALTGRSLWLLHQQPLGFELRNVYRAGVIFSSDAQNTDLGAKVERARSSIAALPGVERAAFTHLVPLSGGFWTPSLQIEGQSAPSEDRAIGWKLVSADYFATLAISTQAGRLFNSSDRAGATAVAVINAAAARRFWPGQDPIGQRIGTQLDGGFATIVGIVGDTRDIGAAAEPPPIMYRPFAQVPRTDGAFLFRIDNRRAAARIIPEITRIVREIDPDAPVTSAQSMSDQFALSVASSRTAAWLTGALAAITVLLSLIGTYGAVAHTTSRRIAEFAVRQALGATRLAVARLVVRETLRTVAPGLAVGLCLAAVGGRMIERLLFEVDALDPWSFAVIAVLICTAAVAASLPSVVRAAGAPPAAAFKMD